MAEQLDNVLVVERMMDLSTATNPKKVCFLGPTQKSNFRYPATSSSNNQIIFNNI